jgi:hypothetical protein
MAGDTRTTTNGLAPYFEIFNNGTTETVPLTELKIRYWFTRDTNQTMLFYCTYASTGCANVTGTFTNLTTPRPGADTYLEIGFSSGNVGPYGSFVEVDTVLHKSDGSSFNQTDDYSFDPTKTTFADWSRVTLYRNGVLVWGTEP